MVQPLNLIYLYVSSKKLMKKDSTEIKKPSFTKLGATMTSDTELMEQFKEFQQFKKMMSK